MRNAAARGGAKIGTFSLFFTHFVASLVKASFSFLYLSASLRIRLLIIVIWNGRIKDVLRLRYIGFVIYNEQHTYIHYRGCQVDLGRLVFETRH